MRWWWRGSYLWVGGEGGTDLCQFWVDLIRSDTVWHDAMIFLYLIRMHCSNDPADVIKPVLLLWCIAATDQPRTSLLCDHCSDGSDNEPNAYCYSALGMLLQCHSSSASIEKMKMYERRRRATSARAAMWCVTPCHRQDHRSQAHHRGCRRRRKRAQVGGALARGMHNTYSILFCCRR
jgi:hypothetical protein